MKIGENWYVHAPWAQLICSTEIPEDKVVKFYAISNEVLDEAKASDDNFGSGVIPQPWRISFDKLGKYGVIDYMMQMVQHYMETILSNGNVKSNLDDIIPGGPHTHWHSRIVDAWVVSQKENDYLPVHAHSEMVNGYQNSKISAVLYLKVPEQMERKPDETSIKFGKDGQIAFTGMGDADPFMTTSLYNIQPEVGWFYLYPSTLNHQVYPFKGEGERRSIAFNVDFISKEQLEKIQKLQGEK